MEAKAMKDIDQNSRLWMLLLRAMPGIPCADVVKPNSRIIERRRITRRCTWMWSFPRTKTGAAGMTVCSSQSLIERPLRGQMLFTQKSKWSNEKTCFSHSVGLSWPFPFLLVRSDVSARVDFYDSIVGMFMIFHSCNWSDVDGKYRLIMGKKEKCLFITEQNTEIYLDY